jgi:hypothetical protein
MTPVMRRRTDSLSRLPFVVTAPQIPHMEDKDLGGSVSRFAPLIRFGDDAGMPHRPHRHDPPTAA